MAELVDAPDSKSGHFGGVGIFFCVFFYKINPSLKIDTRTTLFLTIKYNF